MGLAQAGVVLIQFSSFPLQSIPCLQKSIALLLQNLDHLLMLGVLLHERRVALLQHGVPLFKPGIDLLQLGVALLQISVLLEEIGIGLLQGSSLLPQGSFGGSVIHRRRRGGVQRIEVLPRCQHSWIFLKSRWRHHFLLMHRFTRPWADQGGTEALKEAVPLAVRCADHDGRANMKHDGHGANHLFVKRHPAHCNKEGISDG
mmetsp:Transcript_59789/g.129515  ORF Transcript_59789/g.129515 Transcript_59789/m.129515 type:complete len:202 (+) Transcript_59789:436-1041(+)